MEALEGIRVLDIATVIAAPWAAGLLADFGAEVIKVEMPGRGDAFRAMGPLKDGISLRWPAADRPIRQISRVRNPSSGVFRYDLHDWLS